MRNIEYLKYNFNDNEIILNNCQLLGIENLYPTFDKKEFIPCTTPHYVIKTINKKIHFIEEEKIIEIKFEEMVT